MPCLLFGFRGAGAFMRKLLAILLGTIFLAPSAQAQLLPGGKPAGVQQAALGTTGMILLVSAGLIVVIAAAGITMGGSQSSNGT